MPSGRAEKCKWHKVADLAGGGEVIRLTDVQEPTAYCCHLYLNVPTFTADGDKLVFVAGSVAGSRRENLFLMDLQTREVLQITDLPDAMIHPGWFDPNAGWHYFWRRSGTLCRVNVESLEVQEICSEPARQKSMIGLTCDGQYAVYAASDDEPDRPGPPIFILYKVEVATGRKEKILAAGFRITHVQCSPTDPDFVLYNWECMTPGREPYVPVMQRMWWTNLSGTAGGPFGNQKPNEGRTHEFFTADGQLVGYHGALHDPAGPPTDESIVSFTFGLISTANAQDWRQITLAGPPGHCQMSQDGTLICCDMAGEEHIGLIIDEDPPRYRPLFRHASSMDGQHTHPHPQFRPGRREIVFSTDMAGEGGMRGCSNIYLLRLP